MDSVSAIIVAQASKSTRWRRCTDRQNTIKASNFICQSGRFSPEIVDYLGIKNLLQAAASN
jgi:hypothetical protein